MAKLVPFWLLRLSIFPPTNVINLIEIQVVMIHIVKISLNIGALLVN